MLSEKHYVTQEERTACQYFFQSVHEARTNTTSSNNNNNNNNNNKPDQHLWRRPTAAPFFCVASESCFGFLALLHAAVQAPNLAKKKLFFHYWLLRPYVQLPCVNHICLGSCSKATCPLPPRAFGASAVAKAFFLLSPSICAPKQTKTIRCSCAVLAIKIILFAGLSCTK